MPYKVEDIPGMIKAFDEAKKLIPGQSGYICYALSKLPPEIVSQETLVKCKGLIAEALCKDPDGATSIRWDSLWDWLVFHTNTYFPLKEMPALRHRWIDKIISDLEGYQKCRTK